MMINDDAIGRIERLSDLKDKGMLSVEEFERAKSEILFGKTRRAPTPKPLPAGLKLDGLPPEVGRALVPLTKYADFSGRSSRSEYWHFFVAQVLAFGVLFGLFSMFVPAADAPGSVAADIMRGLTSFLMLILLLGLLVPTLAVQARRFHDIGKSGFLVLINLVPLVGGFIVLIFMALDGNHGPNEFGDDPREI